MYLYAHFPSSLASMANSRNDCFSSMQAYGLKVPVSEQYNDVILYASEIDITAGDSDEAFHRDLSIQSYIRKFQYLQLDKIPFEDHEHLISQCQKTCWFTCLLSDTLRDLIQSICALEPESTSSEERQVPLSSEDLPDREESMAFFDSQLWTFLAKFEDLIPSTSIRLYAACETFSFESFLRGTNVLVRQKPMDAGARLEQHSTRPSWNFCRSAPDERADQDGEPTRPQNAIMGPDARPRATTLPGPVRQNYSHQRQNMSVGYTSVRDATPRSIPRTKPTATWQYSDKVAQ